MTSSGGGFGWCLKSIQELSDLKQLSLISSNYILLIVIFDWTVIFFPNKVQCGHRTEGYFCFCTNMKFICDITPANDNNNIFSGIKFIKVSTNEWSPILNVDTLLYFLQPQQMTITTTMKEYSVVRYIEIYNIETVLQPSPLITTHALNSDKLREYCSRCGHWKIISTQPTARRQTDEMYNALYLCPNQCDVSSKN